MQRNRTIKGILGGLLMVAMLLSVLPTLVLPAVATAAATTWYVDDSGGADFTTTQAAVDAATDGDTIVVKDGTYVENVVVAKSLIIESENGRATTTVQAANSSLDVFNLRNAPSATIRGFTITGANGADQVAGIRAGNGSNLYTYTIEGNDCSGNTCGIYISKSTNSSVSNNICNANVRPNYGAGINVQYSVQCSIMGNTCSSNSGLCGIYTYDSHQSSIIGNTCSSNSGIGIGIYGNNLAVGTISGNTCNNNTGASGYGIYADRLRDNTIANNTASGNSLSGIHLYRSPSNTITRNTCSNNAYGISLRTAGSSYSTLNVIYLNNFAGSTTAPILFTGTVTGNLWNSQVTIPYWYNGNQYTGYMGNYWSNYAGADVDGNGIGDTAYQTRATPNEYDNYPLMGQYGVAIVVAPVAAFMADVTAGIPPLTVHFTDQSSDAPTSWAWDFDNDGTADSTEQNPTNTYATAGTYTVKLTAANAAGSDDEVKTDYITVALPTYTITASAGANGTIDPSGSVAVTQGASQSFAISPATGYHVADVLVDSVSVGAVTSYEFTNVTAAHTIEASFAIDTFTITASAGANGSIDPSGDVTVNYGASQGFTISASTGYHVVDVLVDGASMGAVTSYEFTNVAANHTISVSFAVDVPAWDLNGDGVCNIGDVVVIGLVWGQTGTPGWIPQDLNSDGAINIGDVVVLGLHWGETW